MNSRGPSFGAFGSNAQDDWGNDKNVALFIGGPKNGDYEYIGTRDQLNVVDFDRVYSFAQAYPTQIVTSQHTYYRSKVAFAGKVYTVMASSRVSPRDLEWHVAYQVTNQGMTFNSGGIIPQQYAGWGNTFWIDETAKPEDTRTDEEKIAWVHNGKGKDFL